MLKRVSYLYRKLWSRALFLFLTPKSFTQFMWMLSYNCTFWCIHVIIDKKHVLRNDWKCRCTYIMYMLCPIREIAQFMNCAIGMPSTWTGQEKYCSVHELCSACAWKLFFRARWLDFFQKHYNVANIEFWWCHITTLCIKCLFLCSETH